jgi:hypothetical protein
LIFPLFVEEKDPIITLSILLNKNEINFLSKQLNKLSYSVNEIKGISFLIQLIDLDYHNAVILKRIQKIANVTAEQISKFGRYIGISTKLIHAFNEFTLTIKGEDLIHSLNLKPGKELGDAILAKETENFEKLLN